MVVSICGEQRPAARTRVVTQFGHAALAPFRPEVFSPRGPALEDVYRVSTESSLHSYVIGILERSSGVAPHLDALAVGVRDRHGRDTIKPDFSARDKEARQ